MAGTKGGPTRHGSTEQLSRPRKIGRLLAHPLGHLKGVRNPASQQQRADVCVSDVEPHVRGVERACRDGVSRVRDGHGFGGAPGIRGYRQRAPRLSRRRRRPAGRPTQGFSTPAIAASGWSIANQYTVRKASM